MNGSPSVKVALFIRNGGSESPCRWFYITGIYNYLLTSAEQAVLLPDLVKKEHTLDKNHILNKKGIA